MPTNMIDKQDIERRLRAYFDEHHRIVRDGGLPGDPRFDGPMHQLLLGVGLYSEDHLALANNVRFYATVKDLDRPWNSIDPVGSTTKMDTIVRDVAEDVKEHNRYEDSGQLSHVATLTKDGEHVAELIRPRASSGRGLVTEHPNVISNEDAEKVNAFSGDMDFGDISHAMYMRRPGVEIPETMSDFDLEKDNEHTRWFDENDMLDGFNKSLEEDNERIIQHIQNIKSVMRPIREDRPMFRKVAEPADYEPGDIVTTQSFTSTTLLPEYAVDWSSWMKDHHQVVWEIHSNGKPFQGIVTRNSSEEDIIIDADTPLKVVDIHRQVLFTPSEAGSSMSEKSQPLVIDYVVMEIQPKRAAGGSSGEDRIDDLRDVVKQYHANRQDEIVPKMKDRIAEPMRAQVGSTVQHKEKTKRGRGQIGR